MWRSAKATPYPALPAGDAEPGSVMTMPNRVKPWSSQPTALGSVAVRSVRPGRWCRTFRAEPAAQRRSMQLIDQLDGTDPDPDAGEAVKGGHDQDVARTEARPAKRWGPPKPSLERASATARTPVP